MAACKKCGRAQEGAGEREKVKNARKGAGRRRRAQEGAKGEMDIAEL